MKKVIKTTLTLIIIISFLGTIYSYDTSALKISQQNTTVIVDKNGNGDYQTINKAIKNSPVGSEIYIRNGEYKEILEIKKQIYLIGEGKDTTIINPISKENKYAVLLGAPEIKINKLSITNGAPGLYTSAIRITADNIEIKNCNIYNTPVGISVWSSNNKIENCDFNNCKDEGIALIGSSYYECNNNQITNCRFIENGDGIELAYSSNNIISGCEFYRNSYAGIDSISSSNKKNTIIDCKISENKVYGIYLGSSSENKIMNCDVTNNKQGAIVENGEFHQNEIIYKYNPNDLILEQKSSVNILKDILTKLSRITASKILTMLGLDNF
jgi:parallel beta-helix repeat protein